ncbi:helix-turn-helix domain-containing protein [Saccharopolyspora sp. NPDC050389]|uniref:helix-turn-helix domain-containing protein n=1 Tax=Saccharopolyspora sp. NPDC050389 TaxID=3155516 RepID=UPI0034037363
MIILASAGGNRVPVIAQLVAADQDTVRDVIHSFQRDRPGPGRTAATPPTSNHPMTSLSNPQFSVNGDLAKPTTNGGTTRIANHCRSDPIELTASSAACCRPSSQHPGVRWYKGHRAK